MNLSIVCILFFHSTATTEIHTYRHTLSLPDALPIWADTVDGHAVHRELCREGLSEPDEPELRRCVRLDPRRPSTARVGGDRHDARSEEHTSELQSLMRISYAVFCLKQKNKKRLRPYAMKNTKSDNIIESYEKT